MTNLLTEYKINKGSHTKTYNAIMEQANKIVCTDLGRDKPIKWIKKSHNTNLERWVTDSYTLLVQIDKEGNAKFGVRLGGI